MAPATSCLRKVRHVHQSLRLQETKPESQPGGWDLSGSCSKYVTYVTQIATQKQTPSYA